jgi:surfactin synthase thioesterase subunit
MRASQWLLRIPATSAEGRIFCFPYSGVGASMFNRWPRWIARFEVCPIQLPARENRIAEPHYRTYARLADELAHDLSSLLDRPFVFFGHCAGALPAFETVRRLDDATLPRRRRLVVSAQVAPHHCPHDRMLDQTDDELLSELAEQVRARGGEPHPALLTLALRVLRQDLEANREYRLPGPDPIRTDITVVHWSADPEVTQPELTGWRHYAADVSFRVLDGGHYDFLAAPPPLLNLLHDILEGAGADDR